MYVIIHINDVYVGTIGADFQNWVFIQGDLKVAVYLKILIQIIRQNY
jgi:hypothetical protein